MDGSRSLSMLALCLEARLKHRRHFDLKSLYVDLRGLRVYSKLLIPSFVTRSLRSVILNFRVSLLGSLEQSCKSAVYTGWCIACCWTLW